MADIAWLFFGILIILSNIAPLCWQFKHGNSGPVSLGIWVIIGNLNSVANGFIWRNDAINRAPVFCDISVKIQMAAPSGILASDICILLLLARVVGPSAKLVTHRDRKRRAILDYLFCFGFPALIMACHILFQPFRFGIAKTTGCLVPLVQTWVTWLCFLIWSPLLSFVGCLLSAYVAYRLIRHRRDFKRLVNSSDSALTTSRFVRLALLSSAFFLFNLPLSIYNVTRGLPGIGPYIHYSWSYIHSQFNFVDYNPFKGQADFGDWSNVIAGMLLTVFFGFGSEAMSYYVNLLRWMRILRPDGSRSPGKAKQVEVNHITLTRYEAEPEEGLRPRSHASEPSECMTKQYSGPFNMTVKPDDEDLEKATDIYDSRT